MTRRWIWVLVAGLALGACAKPHWAPPPPAGKTWHYQAQGSFRAARSFGAGQTGMFNYGYFIGHKGYADLPQGQTPDAFWKRQNLRTTRFNEQLGKKGEPLVPEMNTDAPAEAAAGSAAATPSSEEGQ